MKKRLGLMLTGSVVLVLAGTGSAWAHAEFQNPTVPADSHQELVLNVPAERPKAENTRIEITLPDGFDVHSCTADEGWSCRVDNEKDPEHPGLPQVTFTRNHCMAETSYKCKMEAEKADVMLPAAFAPAGFIGVMHEPGEGGGDADHNEGDGPGQTFHFVVHTPAKSGDYKVKVVQRYNTGEIVKWDGAQGSKTPAPILRVQ
jgi:hypothetical protein